MPINNAYIQDPGRYGTPLFMPGETYAFYINFDTPIADPDFGEFKLGIYNNSGRIVSDVGFLFRHFVNGTPLYNIYCEFVFPSVPPDFYWFGIYKELSEEVKCTSNVFAGNMADYLPASNYIQYRDKQDIYGFYYNDVPTFINKFRLLSNKVNTQYETDQHQYRNVTDSKFRNIKAYRDTLVTVETYYFDEGGHEAFSAVLDHDYVLINEGKYTRKSGYTITPRTQSLITKGTVEMYELNKNEVDLEFNTTLTFVFSNVDSSYNVTATFESLGNTTFSFNKSVSFEGLPVTMELKFNGVLFMVVDFLSDYLGKPFKISNYQGVELRGVFTSGEINFIS